MSVRMFFSLLYYISPQVTLSDCRNCKDSRQGHHVPGDPECVIQNMEKIKEEVKKKLRSMGKHGDFEIEEVNF